MMRPGCGKIICAVLAFGSKVASAADAPDAPVDESRFVGSYWSQTQPVANFAYGCRTGWHAFSFGTQGYFLYDGTIAGHWWLDHGTNVRVRTRDGEILILFYNGGDTLVKRRDDTGGSVFGTELKLYRRCDTAADTVVR